MGWFGWLHPGCGGWGWQWVLHNARGVFNGKWNYHLTIVRTWKWNLLIRTWTNIECMNIWYGYCIDEFILSDNKAVKNQIVGYTRASITDCDGEEIHFSAHPNYHGRQWYDWAYVYFEVEDENVGCPQLSIIHKKFWASFKWKRKWRQFCAMFCGFIGVVKSWGWVHCSFLLV
jgi:hypothetical protein